MKWTPKAPAVKPAESLIGTTWKHNNLREGGPAVGVQLPNQFIVKSASKHIIGTWQVGSLTSEQTFWTKADFNANFTQLSFA